MRVAAAFGSCRRRSESSDNRFTWSSSVWITEDGSAYRRYYNPVTREFSWEALELAYDPTNERLGYNVPAWTSIETAIASAWRARAPGSRAHARVLDEQEPPSADTVVWGEEERDEAEAVDPSETWRALNWAIGLVPCDAKYEISSLGRLRSPHTGAVTRGFAAHGARWAAVRGAGLVNLTAAAGLVHHAVTLPPRLTHAYRALQAGMTPPEYAQHADMPEKRAWGYCAQALPFIKHAKSLVAPDLRAVLESMHDDPRLGGPLLPLFDVVAPRLHRDLTMDELRFARVACV